MPCKIYLRGDEDAIFCNEAADAVVQRIEDAEGRRFVQVALTPYGRGDAARTAYVTPGDVSAVLPMHPQEYEAGLDDPPDWLSA
jgi:hypothetical protein